MSEEQAGERLAVPSDGAANVRGLDETHSFVLRIHLHSRPGGEPPRMRFLLEDVGAAQSWRLTDFNTIVERLRERVSAIEATALG